MKDLVNFKEPLERAPLELLVSKKQEAALENEISRRNILTDNFAKSCQSSGSRAAALLFSAALIQGVIAEKGQNEGVHKKEPDHSLVSLYTARNILAGAGGLGLIFSATLCGAAFYNQRKGAKAEALAKPLKL